jgi:hypothetical protein
MQKIFYAGIALMVFTSFTLTGCFYEVKRRPPSARVERVPDVPPFKHTVWVEGYWKYRHGDWLWVPGHWESPPSPGALWAPGHWEKTRRGWKRVPGHWRW